MTKPRLQPVDAADPGEITVSGRSVDDVIRYVSAYLATLPTDGAPILADAVDGIASLADRWRDADVNMDREMPTLLEAASKIAAEYEFPVGELLTQVARIGQRSSTARVGEHTTDTRILDAAYAVFAEKGFYSATVDEIAELAHVGKGTVYRHFESKENLFRRVVDDKLQDLLSGIQRGFRDAEDVLGGIRRGVKAYLSFFQEHKDFYRILMFEQQGFGSGFRAQYIDGIVSNVPLIRDMVVDGAEGGRLKPLDDFYTVFYGLVGFVDGVIHKWYRNNCEGSLEDELDTILEVLFYGFVSNGPHNAPGDGPSHT